MEASPQRTADKEIRVWWWWDHKFRVRSSESLKVVLHPACNLTSPIITEFQMNLLWFPGTRMSWRPLLSKTPQMMKHWLMNLWKWHQSIVCTSVIVWIHYSSALLFIHLYRCGTVAAQFWRYQLKNFLSKILKLDEYSMQKPQQFFFREIMPITTVANKGQTRCKYWNALPINKCKKKNLQIQCHNGSAPGL